MSGGGKAFACDSLTGLHIGFGLNVSADEYKSDVDVLGTAKYSTGGKWTFDVDKCDEKHDLDTGIEAEEINYYYNYTVNDFTLQHTDLDERYSNELEISSEGITIDNFKLQKINETTYGHGALTVDISGDTPILKGQLPTMPRNLTKSIIDDIITSANNDNTESQSTIYYNKHATNIKKEISNLDTNYAHMKSSKHLTSKTNRVGGEIKMSYFQNLTDHLVLGIDVSGTLNQSTKKTIDINKLNYVNNSIYTTPEEPAYKVSYDDYGVLRRAVYSNGGFATTNVGTITSNAVVGFFDTIKYANGERYIPKRTYTIESLSTDSGNIDITKLFEVNPGYTELSKEPNNASQYIRISTETDGDVTFEKNKFNSRAAIVLGAQYKGFFAGVRGGISYNQGKVHATDMYGTSTEDVSFATPFVGLHLMKSVNVNDLDKAHIYLTADVNVDNRQRLHLKGVRNFKQNSVNVSLGITWQIN